MRPSMACMQVQPTGAVRPNAGENSRSAARPPFGLPEMLVAVHTSRLSCREAEKAPIFTPVQESSGESKLNGAIAAFRVSMQTHHVPVRIPLGEKSEALWAIKPNRAAISLFMGSAGRPQTLGFNFHHSSRVRQHVKVVILFSSVTTA